MAIKHEGPKQIGQLCKLTKSSIVSLRAETKRIKLRGTNVVNRPVGDTSGICCKKIQI